MGFLSRMSYFLRGRGAAGGEDPSFAQALARIGKAKSDAARRGDGGPIDWTALAGHEAWFDREDALGHVQARLERGELSAEQAGLLRDWIVDGYVILPGAVDLADIDGVNDYVDNLLRTDVADPDITFLGFTLDEAAGGAAVPHADLVRLPPAERLAKARLSPWRIHELWTRCEAARRIYQNRRLAEAASLIFGCPAYPRSTINFYLGSQQELHQDMTVFHVFPGNYLIGAWVACEDISADSGPLVFSPGSHRAAPYPKFANHPQDTLRTCPLEEYAGYYAYTNALAAQHGTRQFLARKGDVLLWHGMLVHGGSPVRDPSLTRRSMVIHYLREGVDQTASVVGPYNWG